MGRVYLSDTINKTCLVCTEPCKQDGAVQLVECRHKNLIKDKEQKERIRAKAKGKPLPKGKSLGLSIEEALAKLAAMRGES